MKFKFISIIAVSLLASFLQAAPAQASEDKKEKPPLLVYIAAVGEPPAIEFVQKGDSFQQVIQDKEAYPPPNLSLKASMGQAKKNNVYVKLHTSIAKEIYQSVAVSSRSDFFTLICFIRQRNSSDRLRVINLRLINKVKLESIQKLNEP